MRLLLSALFISTFSFFAIAQQADTLITTQRDTLIGKVSFGLANKNTQMVTIKLSDGKKTFKVYEVNSVVKNNTIYSVKKINNIYQFAKQIKTGYLGLYHIVDYETNSSGFHSSVLIKNDGQSLLVPNLTFKKLMSNYLEDCFVVVERFENKIYKKSDLHLIIDDYNQCISEKTNNLLTINSAVNIKLDYLGRLLEKVNEQSDLENKIELLEMLSDVKTKIGNNNSIPSYLRKGLKNGFANHNELLELLELAID